MSKDIEGGCLCGGVRYRAANARTDLTACHCGQCRRTSGHHFVAAHVPDRADFEFVKQETLGWYPASDTAERGFCTRCGASLFWRPKNQPHISVLAGSIDDSTGMAIARHIFVKDKAPHYEINDGIPQFDFVPGPSGEPQSKD